MRSSAIWRGLLAASSVSLFSAAAGAQSLAVAPVTIALAPGELTTTVSVTNRGSTESAVQVRPFAWDQEAGGDRLVPTRDLLVSPPIAKIEAGKTQTIRILLKKQPGAAEDSYRIFFDDIPAEIPANGVRVALRISIPVFALPTHAVKLDLRWQAIATAPGEVELVVTNVGTRHAHLNDIRVATPGGPIRAEGPANLYVLPGAAQHLRVNGAVGSLNLGSTLNLTAHSDEGEIVAPIAITSGP